MPFGTRWARPVETGPGFRASVSENGSASPFSRAPLRRPGRIRARSKRFPLATGTLTRLWRDGSLKPSEEDEIQLLGFFMRSVLAAISAELFHFQLLLSTAAPHVVIVPVVADGARQHVYKTIVCHINDPVLSRQPSAISPQLNLCFGFS